MSKKQEEFKEMKETVVEKVTNELVKANQKSLPVFTKEEKTLYRRLLKGIDSDITKVQKSYLDIAFKLHQIYNSKLYEIDGFKNIYDLAKTKYGLARGTCSDYINIIEKFGYFENGVCMSLLPEFKDFSFSQLIPMLSMTEEQRKLISVNMTVREIKEMKRQFEDSNTLIAEQEELQAENKASAYVQEELDIPESYDGDIDGIIQNSHSAFLASVDCLEDLSRDDLRNVIETALKDFRKNKKGIVPRLAMSLVW